MQCYETPTTNARPVTTMTLTLYMPAPAAPGAQTCFAVFGETASSIILQDQNKFLRELAAPYARYASPWGGWTQQGTEYHIPGKIADFRVAVARRAESIWSASNLARAGNTLQIVVLNNPPPVPGGSAIPTGTGPLTVIVDTCVALGEDFSSSYPAMCRNKDVQLATTKAVSVECDRKGARLPPNVAVTDVGACVGDAELSPQDASLVRLAVNLHTTGARVVIATFDAALARRARASGIVAMDWRELQTCITSSSRSATDVGRAVRNAFQSRVASAGPLTLGDLFRAQGIVA